MTTDRLVGLIEGYRWAPKGKIEIGASEIYLAATWAQRELMSQLRVLEQTIQVVLPANQEKVQFLPIAIGSVTTGNPTILSLPNHKFNTGDEIVVDGNIQFPIINGRWISTKVDGTSISIPVVTGASSDDDVTGVVYHALQGATEIRDNGIVKISDSNGSVQGYLNKVTRADYEFRRSDFINLSPSNEVHRFYEEYTDPFTIHVQGIPASNILTRTSIFRMPLPSEDISPTVNPIIPDRIEKLMVFTTIKTALEMSTEQGAEEVFSLWERRQANEFNKWARILGRSRVVRESNNSEMRW